MPIAPTARDTHSYLGFLLSQHAAALNRATADALAPYGIVPRSLGVLEALAARGPSSQREIGETCRIDRTTMVAIIDELEAAGLVSRAVDPEDRRAHLVRLTRRAATVLRGARAAARRAEDVHCSALLGTERDSLVALLQRSLPKVQGCS
ncbi:MAG TPA: MarR family transcriptional regulator [Gemmatimonadaceae bacterium]|nr:MarR family transcriptional regulator [Gemmatimonadaceae bacterium]